VDVALGVIGLQEEHLCDDGVGHFVVNLGAQENDPVLEEPAVDVHRPLFAAALLDDVGNQGHGLFQGWRLIEGVLREERA
jgi:hypothetical protein